MASVWRIEREVWMRVPYSFACGVVRGHAEAAVHLRMMSQRGEKPEVEEVGTEASQI